MPAKAVMTREQVEQKYTWNLTDLYEDDNAWEADFARSQQIVASAYAYQGKLAESPENLYECLSLRSELHILVSRLYQFAHLSRDLDNRVSKYQQMNERAATLSAQAGAAFAFVEPEILQIDEKKLREMASKFEKTDEYDFYIDELIRSRDHVRSAEVEEVIALSSNIARGAGTIFTMLDDADMKYPPITDSDGEKIELTKQRFYKILEGSDRRLRKEANDAFYSSYADHINTIGASLSASVNRDYFFAQVRKYDSCLDGALDSENIPTSVYHKLIEATEEQIGVLHEYTKLRKRVLKLDPIMPYDMMCSLLPDQDYEVSYDDAVKQTLEATRPLGTAYGDRLQHAFASRWIDVFETQGKGSGAYSYSTFSAHPYILMNYSDTVDNMFTLAHEMGHAMHSDLANSTQPFPKARYSIFVAEVASTLNEALLLDYLLKQNPDKGQQAYLLNRAIDNCVGTYFHQVMYAHFELMIHNEIEKGGALSPEVMNDMWRDLTQKYYGPDMTVDEYSALKWSRIPHFYNAFYVYQYATSFAASQAIATRLIAGEDGLVEKYLKMLSSGGNNHPIEILKICDVDMTTPDPVNATLKLFGEQVRKLDSLI